MQSLRERNSLQRVVWRSNRVEAGGDALPRFQVWWRHLITEAGDGGFTVGLLVVPNFRFPGDLVTAGVPVGRMLEIVGHSWERELCIFVLGTECLSGLRRSRHRDLHHPSAGSGGPGGYERAVPRSSRLVEGSDLNGLFMAEKTAGRDA